MKTIIAYAIVIILGQFCITIGAVGGFLLSFIFFWVPDRFRVPVVSLLGGISGTMLGIWLARLIFNKWVIDDSFGVVPFIAVVLSFLVPIYNDYKKMNTLNSKVDEMPERVKSYTGTSQLGIKMSVTGEIIGIILGGIIFL